MGLLTVGVLRTGRATSPLDSPAWLPVTVRRPYDDEPPSGRVVEWVRADGAAFTDPFFHETTERLQRRPFNALLRPRTGLDTLGAFAGQHPGLPVAGVVAHVSRCGSTLVAQWLASSEDRLVLSEPGPLDDVLRLEEIDHDEHVDLVRAVVAALAQPRHGTERRAYVKLDAWSSRHLPLLRVAFPDAPVVALGRDPVEVLVSAQRQRGAHMVPGALPPETFGIAPQELASLPPEEYMARVLASVYGALLAGPADAHVDFADLVDRRCQLLALLGVDDEPALDMVDTRHAKAPERPYVDDRADKQAAASPALRAACERLVSPLYADFLRRAA